MKSNLTKVFIFMLVALMILATAGCGTDKNNNNDDDNNVVNLNSLPKFGSYDDMVKYFDELEDTNRYYYATDDAVDFDESADMAPEAQDGATNETSGDSGSTNVQVEGIDEGDILKNDGRYLYITSYRNLVIVDAKDPSDLKLVAEINIGDRESINQVYVFDGKLVLLGNRYEDKEVYYEEKTSSDDEKVQEDMMVDIMPWYGKDFTTIKVFDITDLSNPVLEREVAVEGWMISSRLKDGKFYIATNKWMYGRLDDNSQPENVLPGYYDSKAGEELITIEPNEISYAPGNFESSYLLISVLDVANDSDLKIETILGGGSQLYMSHNAIYITKYYSEYEILERTTDDGQTYEEYNVTEEGTMVVKYNLTSDFVTYAGTGKVPGYPLNQFSMDEYNGDFRIATTMWTRDGNNNGLYILDSNMKLKGKIENIAPGERIYSVRFMGESGYVVTFRNVDPLFIIDLSDAKNPVITGELKIPGFSNYLHPVGDNKLLGIGQDTQEVFVENEQGEKEVVGFRTGGLKVSLFDVSNPQIPREIDNIVLGNNGSYSEAQYNHKAFLFWTSRNLAMFPASINENEYSGWWGGFIDEPGMMEDDMIDPEEEPMPVEPDGGIGDGAEPIPDKTDSDTADTNDEPVVVEREESNYDPSKVYDAAVFIKVDGDQLSLDNMIKKQYDSYDYYDSYYYQSRVTYIGNTVFYLFRGSLFSYNYDTLQELDELVFPKINNNIEKPEQLD